MIEIDPLTRNVMELWVKRVRSGPACGLLNAMTGDDSAIGMVMNMISNLNGFQARLETTDDESGLPLEIKPVELGGVVGLAMIGLAQFIEERFGISGGV